MARLEIATPRRQARRCDRVTAPGSARRRDLL